MKAMQVKGKSGSSVKTAVIKGTRSDGLAPKRKHVQFLVQATKGQKPHAYPIISAIRLRLARQDWQVGVKALTIVHWLINTGGHQFRIAASRTNVVTTQFADIQAPGYSAYVRDYAKYLESRLRTITKLDTGFSDMLEDEDDFLDGLEIDEVLDLVPLLLKSLDHIIELKSHFSMFTNQITIASFSIILKDSIKLYQLLSKALLRVTDEYKTLSKKEAQTAFKSYEHFINSSDTLIDDFFPACSRFTKKLPKFKKIPDSILDTLEDYIETAPKTAPKRAARKKKPKGKKGRGKDKEKKGRRGRGKSKKADSEEDYSTEEVARHVERERRAYEEEENKRAARPKGGRYDREDHSSELSNSGEGADGAGTLAEQSLIDFNMFAQPQQQQQQQFQQQQPFGSFLFAPQTQQPVQQQVASPFGSPFGAPAAAASPFGQPAQPQQAFSPFSGDAFSAQQAQQLQQQQQQQQQQLLQQQQQLQMQQQMEAQQLVQAQAQAQAQQQAKQQAIQQQQQYLAQQQMQLQQQQQQQQQMMAQPSPFMQQQYLSQPAGGFTPFNTMPTSAGPISAFNGDGTNLPALPKTAPSGGLNVLDDGAFDPFKVINLG